MRLAIDTFSHRFTLALWILRALWASMLLSPMILYVSATWITDLFTEAIAKGNTTIVWNERLPWETWILAAILVAGSIVVPSAVERRSTIRLRDRVAHGVDPSRPGLYRSPPGMLPQISDVLIRAALARYATRITLSFTMLGTVILLCIWGFMCPVTVSGLGFAHRYFWRPMDYLPMIILASLLMAAQLPTRRRVLRILTP